MKFSDKLNSVTDKNNSLLCIGLDPDIHKFPKHLQQSADPIFTFNKEIIDATSDLVCVYKPNIAFYEAEGISGLTSLKKTIQYLKKQYPHIPILLDAKRGDIGNTAAMYAKAIYEYWQADATTVYPHLGLDSLLPYLKYKDKLTIVLIKTSNPDAKMFQDLPVGNNPYYFALAKQIARWKYENIGIFIGATYPKELKEIRRLFPKKIFLSAGLGAQEGTVEEAVKAGINKEKKGIMFNASRSILYAGNGKDFAQKAREEAEKLRNEINKARESV